MARLFWIFGAGLSVLAMLLMASGGPGSEGIIDYRAWLLLALAILVLGIGNVSRTPRRKG